MQIFVFSGSVACCRDFILFPTLQSRSERRSSTVSADTVLGEGSKHASGVVVISSASITRIGCPFHFLVAREFNGPAKLDAALFHAMVSGCAWASF